MVINGDGTMKMYAWFIAVLMFMDVIHSFESLAATLGYVE